MTRKLTGPTLNPWTADFKNLCVPVVAIVNGYCTVLETRFTG